MNRDLQKILLSGYVTRWHFNPHMAHIRETLAEHHCRVAQIICALHPSPSMALVQLALHHDCPELVTGDLPPTMKKTAIGPDLKEYTQGAAVRMGVHFDIFDDEILWLEFADKLAAYLHVQHFRPETLRQFEWIKDRHRLWQLAEELNLTEELKGMIHEN